MRITDDGMHVALQALHCAHSVRIQFSGHQGVYPSSFPYPSISFPEASRGLMQWVVSSSAFSWDNHLKFSFLTHFAPPKAGKGFVQNLVQWICDTMMNNWIKYLSTFSSLFWLLWQLVCLHQGMGYNSECRPPRLSILPMNHPLK